jgi:hypothetical protein
MAWVDVAATRRSAEQRSGGSVMGFITKSDARK